MGAVPKEGWLEPPKPEENGCELPVPNPEDEAVLEPPNGAPDVDGVPKPPKAGVEVDVG